MDIKTKKLRLIERLMRVRREGLLDQMEAILIQAEMENRANASIQDIEQDRVIPLENFSKENTEWLKEKASR